jgi:hypothetical protein
MNEAAKDVLASKGSKLHVAETHIRPTANKGYIVKHDLRDEKGNPPSDGQSATREYHMNNPAELAAHVAGPGNPQMPPNGIPDPAQPQEAD